jgi:anti-sigma B factor antagonist
LSGTGSFVARVVGDGRVEVRGEVDLLTRPTLRAALLEALEGSASTVVVDMAAVEFLDAAGIGALVEISGRARREGRSLVVSRPSRIVRRVLGLVPLDLEIAHRPTGPEPESA